MNFMTEEESDRVAAAYGSNYPRLVDIKKRKIQRTSFT